MFSITKNQTSLTARIHEVNQQLPSEIQLEITEFDSVIVWLNRQEKRNALNFHMIDKLIWLAKVLNRWTDIRAVIISGKGKSFCTGMDTSELNNTKNLTKVAWELLKPTQSKFQQVCLAWRKLSVPVIAVIHGHCVGAGLQLALATDIRFSTPDCQFSIMETKWGLVPDMGLTQSGLGILRVDILKELTMTARLFDGTQALHYGIVTNIADEPMTEAKKLLAEIAERSPDAVFATKRLINQMYHQSHYQLYQEKFWQIRLLLTKNRVLAIQKAKDNSIKFLNRQFR